MDAVHSESPSYPRTMSIGAFRALRESFPPPQVLDVRRNAAFESDPAVIPGSVRCAPEDVGAIAGSLEPWRPVVAVCVYGHEVSRNAATELAARGCDARSLDEGIAGWRAAGGPHVITVVHLIVVHDHLVGAEVLGVCVRQHLLPEDVVLGLVRVSHRALIAGDGGQHAQDGDQGAQRYF